MRTLNDYFITSAIPDVSSGSSTFVCVPDGGRIIKIITHNKATTSGTAAISFEIGGVAVEPLLHVGYVLLTQVTEGLRAHTVAHTRVDQFGTPGAWAR